MRDEGKPPEDDRRPFDRPGPMMIMLWVVAASMLLAVGLWLSG